MNIAFLEDTRLINERLESLYGKHTVKNLPNFRLAFVGDLTEKRQGTFTVTTESGIYLREETGIREVSKYPYCPDNSWILERLVPNLNPDVMGGDYVYEPIYNFPENVFPIWRAVEFFMIQIFHKRNAPQTQKDADLQESESKKAETQKIRNIIEGVKEEKNNGKVYSR